MRDLFFSGFFMFYKVFIIGHLTKRCKVSIINIKVSTLQIRVLTNKNFANASRRAVKNMQLSQRKQLILAAVVELYIDTGEPVSSKQLMDALEMSVSSATIRNDMSDLASLGLLTQPHTSAGRIPTPKGFRYYIDHLMKKRVLSAKEKHRIEGMLPKHPEDAGAMLKNVSSALAALTGCASLFTTPSDKQARIKRIDLIPVGRFTALILLQTSTGVIKNRMCRSDCEITNDFIEMFKNIAVRHFFGIPLADVSLALVQTITASLGEHALLMSPVLVTVCDVARDAIESELKLDGESNLWSRGDYGDSVQQLVSFLGHRDLVRKLVDRAGTDENGLKIVLGQESQIKEMENSSMILSQYNIGGKSVGNIGVIGPLRINYAQIVPSIEYLTSIVGNLLSELFAEEEPHQDKTETGKGGNSGE